MTHPSPTTDPNAARDDDDHTIVVPPEDRCLVVLDGLRTSERPSGRERLARRLAALVEAQEHRPRTAAEACVLRGLEAMLGVRKLRQVVRRPTLASVTKQARKAGIDPSRIEIKPDGTYVVDIGNPHADEEVTPLEQWRKRRGQG